jgi:hypothetical protein
MRQAIIWARDTKKEKRLRRTADRFSTKETNEET